jgi:D-glycero-D-manno-heptose 1,7-bisphosphate phosphatase
MFLSAKKTYDIDMKNSWMIGDKETDIIAANAAGINNTILVRYNQNIDKSDSNASYFVDSIKDTIKVIVS